MSSFKSKLRADFALYLLGYNSQSQEVETRIRNYLNEHLQDAYSLEIVDLQQQPERARVDQIIGIPTLLRKKPEPPLQVVGDFSHQEKKYSLF